MTHHLNTDTPSNPSQLPEPEILATPCPRCGGIIRERGANFRCGCGVKIGRTIFHRKMSGAEISALLKYGRTILLKGFVSNRTGEVFDAFLTYAKSTRKIGLDFLKPGGHDGTCPKCKVGQLVRKEGAKAPFWFCSQWNATTPCDAAYRDDNGEPLVKAPIFCPKCKTGRLHLRQGENPFWSCSNYRNTAAQCKATYPDRDGVPDLKSSPRVFSAGIRNAWNCIDVKNEPEPHS